MRITTNPQQQKKHDHHLSIYLTAEQLEQVKALAIIKGQKSAVVIRGIVDDYLERIRQ